MSVVRLNRSSVVVRVRNHEILSTLRIAPDKVQISVDRFDVSSGWNCEQPAPGNLLTFSPDLTLIDHAQRSMTR